jgi:hypothetical protein
MNGLETARKILDESDGDGVVWSEGSRVFQLMRGDEEPAEVTDEDEIAKFWMMENKDGASA